MGWDRRGYYRRSKKVNGTVVTEYCGGGLTGQLCAGQDTLRRQRQEAERQAHRNNVALLTDLDNQVAGLDRLADLLARAALLAAGYHQHHRGPWRRQRVPSNPTG